MSSTGTHPAGPCSLGDYCQAPTKTRQKRYKCMNCSSPLHPYLLGCGVFVPGGDEHQMRCPDGYCKSTKTNPETPAAKKASSVRTHQKPRRYKDPETPAPQEASSVRTYQKPGNYKDFSGPAEEPDVKTFATYVKKITTSNK